MERIPQEIYDRIAMHLEDVRNYRNQPSIDAERASNYSSLTTVSRKWQCAIERRNFRTIKLRSNELDDFETIMTSPRRRYLRSLRYYVILPSYPLDSHQMFESHDDRTTNDEAFSIAIHRLFQIVEAWEDQSRDQSGYSLQFHLHRPYSLSDYRFRARPYMPTGEERRPQHQRFGTRYLYSYVRLLEPTQLPVLSGIEAFEHHGQSRYHRKVAPQTLIEIAARLPKLRKLRGKLADTESRYPALRRQCRDSLIQAIKSLLFPASVQHLSLILQHWAPMDQTWQATSLLHPGAERDPLSSALWRATSHQSSLLTLHIEGVLDASLLWPRNIGKACGLDIKPPEPVEPFWQNLRSLVVKFNLTSPSGDWYFSASQGGRGNISNPALTTKAESDTAMPPGYDSSEQEDRNASLSYRYSDELMFSGSLISRIFRFDPNEPVLTPLVEAFARACSQIPDLETATLVTDLLELIELDGETHNLASEWGLYFAAPAHQSSWHHVSEIEEYPTEDLTVARLTFNTRNWQPDEDLRQILRGIGGYDERLKEKHLDLWETVEKPEAEGRVRPRGLVRR